MSVPMEKGAVSIDAQNIMPVIKRWLYSDKDIFLREAVSNGCDAVTKYNLLKPGHGEEMSVTVTVDKENKVIRITDTGIGMTADEVRRYINQVAFSSASEFMKNMEGDSGKGDIIGHFGLGFYSVFMVSDKVEIDTLSWQEGAEAVHWQSTDGMDYEMESGNHPCHGTTVTLHISDDEAEFLEMARVREVLQRYCGYMATPVYLEDASAQPTTREVPVEGETNEDGSAKTETVVEMPKPRLINDTEPLWLKKPSDCEDKDYIDFYHKMFGWEEPLFWIHLNVDYPFNLKGILYFPRLKNDFGAHEGQVKLFAGQVFVADNVKEVIPEFLMLLKGVIDCPDLPLNVSRSFLQNDGTVKKVSAHITKKVADKLVGLYNTERETYESYWDDIAPFVKYGAMRDSKFFEQVKKALLYKTTEGTYLTLEEYQNRNGDKADKKVYYTNDPKRQAASVKLYRNRDIDVAVMDHIIDSNFLSFMEYGPGSEGVTFARVDADVSGLTEESEEGKDLNQEALQEMFRKALQKDDLPVTLTAFADADLPAMVTEDEQMRRMKEMSRLYGQSFDIPDRYTLVLNRRNETVQALAARPEDDTTVMLCQHLYDLARMAAQPLESDELTAFMARAHKLLAMVK